MYENTTTSEAQDLVHYLGAIIEEFQRRFPSEPKVEGLVDGTSVFGGVLNENNPAAWKVSHVRTVLIDQVRSVADALTDVSGRPELARELLGVLKGKPTTLGVLAYAKGVLKILKVIERCFHPRADFRCGCIWHTDDAEIQRPEWRSRLDGSKIQEPPCGPRMALVDGQALPVQQLPELPELPDPAPEGAGPEPAPTARPSDWPRTKGFETLIAQGLPRAGVRVYATPEPESGPSAADLQYAAEGGEELRGSPDDLDRALEYQTPEYGRECMHALELGSPIPTAHQFNATEALRVLIQVIPYTEKQPGCPFGSDTRFLSDGTPVGPSFVRECLKRLSRLEGPFELAEEKVGYWIARPGPDVPAMSQNAWRVVEVMEDDGWARVYETGEENPSEPKSWIFREKVSI